ncbi:hypothetical protein [Ferrimicrobium acidiphilum]|jgi:hypothetical protein|uniref:hypothetical protein n=1 Tax=Ferrimicrobium acidiphilum TaxID=121039 RepID=UPI0023F34F18|nr:hypothetical protein [Ferrimicrobium acidiphilum]
MENNDIAVCRQHDGREVWRLNRKLHREGGPAFVGADGTQYWYKNGERHREGGPAVTRLADGSEEWWIHGGQVDPEPPDDFESR